MYENMNDILQRWLGDSNFSPQLITYKKHTRYIRMSVCVITHSDLNVWIVVWFQKNGLTLQGCFGGISVVLLGNINLEVEWDVLCNWCSLIWSLRSINVVNGPKEKFAHLINICFMFQRKYGFLKIVF